MMKDYEENGLGEPLWSDFMANEIRRAVDEEIIEAIKKEIGK